MITIDWGGKPVGLLGYPPPPPGPSLSSTHPVPAALDHHNRKGQMVECETLGNLWTLVFPRLRRVGWLKLIIVQSRTISGWLVLTMVWWKLVPTNTVFICRYVSSGSVWILLFWV